MGKNITRAKMLHKEFFQGKGGSLEPKSTITGRFARSPALTALSVGSHS